jgi:hypothetical protein
MRRTVRRRDEDDDKKLAQDENDEDVEEEEEEEEEEEDDEEDDDDEEDEDLVEGGWGAYERGKAKSGGFAEFIRLAEEPSLIKFLQPSPFANFRQHWIDRRQGKRSWVCIEDDCPLCNLGDDPAFRVLFNVLVLSEDKPMNRVWEMGGAVAEQVKAKMKDKRTTPIDRDDVYWAASRTGKKQQTRYALDPVKERDLEEDWDIKPLSEDELEKYRNKVFDKKIIKIPTRKQLLEIAEEVSGDYDDEEE